MLLTEVILTKIDGWYAVDIPMVHLHTQGKTLKEALAMASDAVEELVNTRNFKATPVKLGANSFGLRLSDSNAFLRAALKQNRCNSSMSIRDVVATLGLSSPNAYGKYENTEISAAFSKFIELMSAVAKDFETMITLKKRA